MKWRGCIVLAASALAGCGRIGFDLHSSDDAALDAVDGDGADAAYATPQIVQTQANGNGGTSLTLGINATIGGSLLVVAIGSFGPPANVTTVSDDAGSTYVSANAHAAGSGAKEIWYAAAAMPGATMITVNWDATTSMEIWFTELTGMDPAPLDVVATTDNGVLADPVSAPSITPTTTPAYVVSMIGGAGAVGAIHAPFTELMPLYGDDTAYVITTTAGAYGAIWDDTNTGAYEASTVAFKPAKR